MVYFLKNFFKRKKYIKISYIGKFGMRIDTNFTDDEVQDFLLSVYTDQIINDVMEYLKVYKEDQYIRIVKFLEEKAKLVQQEVDSHNQDPIIGVLSENNNMGRS
jgi:hypothetical protein